MRWIMGVVLAGVLGSVAQAEPLAVDEAWRAAYAEVQLRLRTTLPREARNLLSEAQDAWEPYQEAHAQAVGDGPPDEATAGAMAGRHLAWLERLADAAEGYTDALPAPPGDAQAAAARADRDVRRHRDYAVSSGDRQQQEFLLVAEEAWETYRRAYARAAATTLDEAAGWRAAWALSQERIAELAGLLPAPLEPLPEAEGAPDNEAPASEETGALE